MMAAGVGHVPERAEHRGLGVRPLRPVEETYDKAVARDRAGESRTRMSDFVRGPGR